MKKVGLVLVLVVMLVLNSSGQQTKGIEDLKKMTRKDLIDRAVKHINDPDFKLAHYDRVKVMANSTKMYVVFDVSVRYIPVLTSYYIPVYVDMVSQKISIKEVSNSGFFSSEYYANPKTYEKVTKQVLDGLSKHTDKVILPGGVVGPDVNVTIREVYGHFDVEVTSDTMNSTCKVDKVTLKVFDLVQTENTAKKSNSMVEIK